MHRQDKDWVDELRGWGRALGFDAVGISSTDLDNAWAGLDAWLAAGKHGAMDYMARHGSKRTRPNELVPGTRSIITVRMNYRPASVYSPMELTDLSATPCADAESVLGDRSTAYISRYALGRDYHKLMRQRLQKLVDRMHAEIGDFSARVFTDSAPVMEVEVASRSGIGWRGKHTLLLDRSAGSWFFLGEIFTDLALPPDAPTTDHCGSCTACLDSCPTQAFDGPYKLDSRRCISYLTIEMRDSIPEHLRSQMGNRIYGCDDCQLACPWNRFSTPTREADFAPRHGLDSTPLVELFAWTEAMFEERLAGSAIRRIGYEVWLRNIAVGLGNAPSTPEVINALRARLAYPSPLVRDHVVWALGQHGSEIS